MPELYARLLRVYTGATSMTRLSDIVHSDPDILGGTPVFVGARVPIQSLFDYLEGGETLDEFLRQFPSVKRDQAVTALELDRATFLAGVRSFDEQLPVDLAAALSHEFLAGFLADVFLVAIAE